MTDHERMRETVLAELDRRRAKELAELVRAEELSVTFAANARRGRRSVAAAQSKRRSGR
jgi:hypothetical protein